MLHIESLDGGDAAETGDLGLDGLELAAGGEHAQPGLGILGIGHVVVGVVAGNDHQGPEDDGIVPGGGDGLDNGVAGGLLGLALNGADEHVVVAESGHLGLHLGVGHLGGVGGAVAHEHEGHAGLLGGGQVLVLGLLQGGGHNGLGDGFLVGVDDGGVSAHLAQQRLGDAHGLELVLVLLHSLHQLVVLGAVHQVGGLDDKVLHAVGDGALQGLVHVVDELAVTGLNMVDDDLSGESSADGPAGEGGGQSVFNAPDVLSAAVIEGRAEAHDQELVLADVVGVAGIVFGGVAGVAAEVVGIGVLTLDQLLLGVGEGVPGLLGGQTLGVGLLGALLYVDGVDQLGYRVSRCLIRRINCVVGSPDRSAERKEHADRQQQRQELL